MKTIRYLPYLLVFSLCLILGYQAGNRFSLPDMPVRTETVQQPELRSFAVLPNGQRSLLMVVVDGLKAPNPRLKSAWLILYLPNDPRLTMLPVFPSTKDGKSAWDTTLANEFKIVRYEQGGTGIDPSFYNALQTKKIWWSGSALIDEYALDKIARSFINQGESNSWISIASTSISKAGKPPVLTTQNWSEEGITLLGQAYYFHDLCWKAALFNNQESGGGQDIFSLIPEHFNIDFTTEQLEVELQILRGYGSNLFCDFPILADYTLAAR